MTASYFQEANQLYRSGKLEEAVEMYKKAIGQNPNSHLYHHNLGEVLRKLGHIEEANKEFKKALELKSSDSLFSLDPETILEQKSKNQELINSRITELVIAKNKENISQNDVIVNYCCWLSPKIIYLEIPSQQLSIVGAAQVGLINDKKKPIAKGYFFELSQAEMAAIIMFENALELSEQKNSQLSIRYKDSFLSISLEQINYCHGLEFIQYLNNKPAQKSYSTREKINWAIIECNSLTSNSDAAQIIYKLQHFISYNPVSLIEANYPFNVVADNIIPIGNEGVLLLGWLHDAFNALQKIELFSDLGFSLSIDYSQLNFLERLDVNEYIAGTNYPQSNKKAGFFTYISIPETIRKKINKIGNIHSFRLKFILKGGIEFEIIPKVKHYDVFDARKMILQLFSSLTDFQTIEKCLSPVLAGLQKIFVQQVKEEEVLVIKKSISKEPLVSIIIPLYKQLEFVKIQLATMANDPDIQQSEIIYVLDSPEQKQEVKNLLIENNQIYDLPIKLVIMNQNSGYAIANNTGAMYAEGRYLLLMNSDVFPQNKGWLLKMVHFYSSSPKIGTLGPKLIYEDHSLQHAGMFFEQTIFPFWITGHYHKGLPHIYGSVNISRAVPAITGACLLIKRELYELVDGFTTDYIIGDFEDSDLCFKCHDLGYESWYFAEVELYHLERQSMSLSTFNRSLSWRYNALLHQKKWHNKIQELMDISNNK